MVPGLVGDHAHSIVCKVPGLVGDHAHSIVCMVPGLVGDHTHSIVCMVPGLVGDHTHSIVCKVPGLVGDHAPPVCGTVELQDFSKASLYNNRYNLIHFRLAGISTDLSSLLPYGKG